MITTRKLYDDVAGIQNVKIRLYKIEAEREVPISCPRYPPTPAAKDFCLPLLY